MQFSSLKHSGLDAVKAAFPSSFQQLNGEFYAVSLDLVGEDRKQNCVFWPDDSGVLWTAVSPIGSSSEIDRSKLMALSDIDLPITFYDGDPHLMNVLVLNAEQVGALVDLVGQTASYADYLQQKLVEDEVEQ